MMKRVTLIAAAGLFVMGLVACAQMSTSEKDMGLARGTALDSLEPKSFVLDGKGAGGTATAAYLKPPLSNHEVDSYLPITIERNQCLACHGNRDAKKAPNTPTPAPASHYRGGQQIAGAYYKCDLCHAAAANVPDLVRNTGPKPKR